MKIMPCVVLIALGVFIVISSLAVFTAPLIFQEEEPRPLVRSIILLELTRREIVPVGDRKLLPKNGPESFLTDFLEGYGWEFKDRLGAGIFYKKENELLFAETRMLTRFYVIYELDRELI